MSPWIRPDPTVTVLIRYNGIDITDDCVIAECWFQARASGFPGEAEVVIKDTAQTMTFTPGDTLELFLDGARQWDGYAIARKYNYWFEGHTANCYPCPHITPRRHTLVGVDRNILFERRWMYNKASPATAVANQWPANSMDEEVIEESIALYLDDIDGLDFTTKVETVGAVDPYVEVRVPGPTETFGNLLRQVANATGAIFYIDPDRYLIYTDVNEPNGPFVLTDRPETVGEVGYRDLTLLHDGSQMVNDALIWGAGLGSPNIIFSRVTDTNPDWFNTEDRESLELHGRWQNPNGFRPGVWLQATADRIANSIVYGSPSSKRGHKDEAVSAELTLFSPGLRVADKVEFHSEVHGFTDVIPVRNMRISFPTPHNVRYEVRLSHELDLPLSLTDPWEPEREEDPPERQPTTCTIPPENLGQGIFVGTANPVTSEDFLFKGNQEVVRGFIDSSVSIQHGDGFPPNKLTYTGNNAYESNVGGSGFQTGSISDPPGLFSEAYVEVYRWYADKYWYNVGDGDLQVEGGPLYRWRNYYTAYKTPLNTINPAWPVVAVITVTLTMSGSMADRDVTGFLVGVSRDNSGPATGDWPVVFGYLQPERFFKQPHTIPSAMWEGTMNSGDTYTFTGRLLLQGHAFYMLGVDFQEIATTPQPWLDNIQVVADISISYENELLGNAIIIGPDEDGLPCIEMGGTHVCETAVLLHGRVYRVSSPYALGSTEVSVDGLTLSGTTQYDEVSPQLGRIELVDDPTGDVYVCYDTSYYSVGMPDPTGQFILPVTGSISATFGSQMGLWPEYVWHGQYYEHFHNGVDFGVGIGTPVFAAADGTVRYEDQEAGGMMIHIHHPLPDGFRTTYAHLSARVVDNNSQVLQGQLIAYSGDSGNVTGAHLHWGLVYDGSAEDPLVYTEYDRQEIF